MVAVPPVPSPPALQGPRGGLVLLGRLAAIVWLGVLAAAVYGALYEHHGWIASLAVASLGAAALWRRHLPGAPIEQAHAALLAAAAWYAGYGVESALFAAVATVAGAAWLVQLAQRSGLARAPLDVEACADALAWLLLAALFALVAWRQGGTALGLALLGGEAGLAALLALQYRRDLRRAEPH
jgi:hypothetical protein